ncbi:MAG: hypothetical protein JWM88_3362, partial [Verrucomicrobia bacterium]|nr:hypothetical protein [Verrucomicrobiota bacterium]
VSTSRLAAQLLCRKTGSAATPSRGTGDICLHAARATEEKAAPVATLLSPVARDYPSRALGGFFMPPHCDCSIKERRKNEWLRAQSHGFVPLNLFTRHCGRFASAAVNNLCPSLCSPVVHNGGGAGPRRRLVRVSIRRRLFCATTGLAVETAAKPGDSPCMRITPRSRVLPGTGPSHDVSSGRKRGVLNPTPQ